MDDPNVALELFDLIEAGDFDGVAALLTDDFVFSGPVPEPIGAQMYIGFQAKLKEAFPDWSFNVSHGHAHGDTVHVNVDITGTHTGNLDLSPMGLPVVPATGIAIQLPTEDVYVTVRGDRVAALETAATEGAGVPGILAQLGVDMG